MAKNPIFRSSPVFLFLLILAFIFVINTEAAVDKTSADVRSRMQSSDSVPIIIILKDQPSFKKDAVSSMKNHVSDTQENLGALLNEEKNRGKADKIRRFWIVNAVAVTASPGLIERLTLRDDVAGIELDSQYHILEDHSAQVTDGEIASATGEIRRINAPKLWKFGIDGSGINVSVIDTGINASHPDIAGRIIRWADFINGQNNTPYDDNGHGTHIAGTIGGNGSGGITTGVAPNVNIFSVKVLNSSGIGSSSDVIGGIEWSVGNGADILSLSLSGERDPALAEAVNNAINAGVVVIASAGNSGPDASTIEFPASEKNVIAVGATTRFDFPAPFSSRGPSSMDGENLTKPDVSAPGTNIISLRIIPSNVTYGSIINDLYATLSGTSMATPHVSGAAALILHAAKINGTTLSPARIKNILEAASVDLGEPGKDDSFGAGRIDAFAAIAPSVTVNPTGYLPGLTASRNGTPITLNATITDAIAGVKNASVNISSINATLTSVSLFNVSGYWIYQDVTVYASDGIYPLNITAFNNMGFMNDFFQLSVIVDNTQPLFISADAQPSTIEAGRDSSVLSANITDATGVLAAVDLSSMGSSNSSMVKNLTGGLWEKIVNSTSVGNFSLIINASDSAGNSNTTALLLNVTDTTPPIITMARANPDSILANGIDNASLILGTHDFASVSVIAGVTVDLTQFNGSADQTMILDNGSNTWKTSDFSVAATLVGLGGSLIRIPVNITDGYNNSNTGSSIPIGIKKAILAPVNSTTAFNITIDSRMLNVSISIPASTDMTGELLAAPVDVPELPPFLKFAGVALNLTNLTFNRTIRIEMEYDHSFFNDPLNESRLRLWSFDPAGRKWEMTENSTVNVSNKTTSGDTTHFTVFAPLADTAPPVITGVNATSITTGSARITWITDEPSSGHVKYGASSGAYANTALNISNATSHSVLLAGLSPGTKYFFIVESADLTGNSASSSENDFTTVFPEVFFSGSSGSSSGSLPLAGQGDEGSLMHENFSNVELHEKYDEFIFKDRVTSYRFKSKGNPVVFANITGNANAGIITTMIEVLRDISAFVNESTQGMVYKNFNIRVGTTGFGAQKNIKEAVIRFRVENSWLDNNSLTGLDIRMVKWNGSKWIPQGTDVKEKDAMNTYFEAKTDSFSQFAIVGIKVPGDIMKGGASGVPEARPAETQTPGRPEAPGFEAAAAIAVLFALYILRRR